MSDTMSDAQALEILGLEAGPTENEIRAAYNRLMQKVHPDGGFTYGRTKRCGVIRR